MSGSRRGGGAVIAVSIATALAVVASAASLHAQDIATPVNLGSPLSEMSGFEAVRQVRELSDGSILVTSGRSATPALVNLAHGTSSALLREGDGPGELRQSVSIFALSGDSSVVVDLQRWVVLDHTKAVATLRSWLAGMYPPQIQGIDDSGRILEVSPAAYGVQPGVRVTPTHRNASQLMLLLHRRAPSGSGIATSGDVDTLLRIRGAFRGIRRVTKRLPNAPNVTYELAQELATDDQAVLFRDGWIAVVYAEPYRVDWYSPSGRKVAGAPLPFDKVRVDLVQKRAVIASSFPTTPDFLSPDDYPPWPEFLPPFVMDAILPSPNGSVVIRRTADARKPYTMYDIVGRNGLLAGRLRVGINERIVGFGDDVVYVVKRDNYDLETIARYKWPFPR